MTSRRAGLGWPGCVAWGQDLQMRETRSPTYYRVLSMRFQGPTCQALLPAVSAQTPGNQGGRTPHPIIFQVHSLCLDLPWASPGEWRSAWVLSHSPQISERGNKGTSNQWSLLRMDEEGKRADLVEHATCQRSPPSSLSGSLNVAVSASRGALGSRWAGHLSISGPLTASCSQSLPVCARHHSSE